MPNPVVPDPDDWEPEYQSPEVIDQDALYQDLESHQPQSIRQGGVLQLDAATSEVQQVDNGEMKATFVIVTRQKSANRNGNMVQILPGSNGQGILLDNYRLNPVVLFDHGHSGVALPIGVSEDKRGNLAVKLMKSKATAEVYFSRSLPFAADIFGLVSEKVLRMASIGYLAKKGMRLVPPKEQNAEGVQDLGRDWPGFDFTESDLFEWSITPIGADAGALRQCLERGRIGSEKLSAFSRPILQRYAEKPKAWSTGFTVEQRQSVAEIFRAELDVMCDKICQRINQDLERRIIGTSVDTPREQSSNAGVSVTETPTVIVQQTSQPTHPPEPQLDLNTLETIASEIQQGVRTGLATFNESLQQTQRQLYSLSGQRQ